MARRVQVWAQQAVVFPGYDAIAFAAKCCELRTINDFDLTAAVIDYTQFLEFAGGFAHALATHAQHVGDQLLSHVHFVRCRSIEAQQ